MAVSFGDFAFDQERRQLLRSGEPVPLEAKAYELLGLLLSRRPNALSKAQIRAVLWPGTFVSESALARLVTQLRAACGDDAQTPRFIRTVHGFGYAFCGDAREAGDEPPAGGVEPAVASPYPGLSPFAEEDADRFFGREAEVEALWGKLHRQKLLAVIGPSGVGKTSLLRAGLIPHRPRQWAAVACTPGGQPFVALGQALAPLLAADSEAISELFAGVSAAIQGEEPGSFVSAISRWRRRHAEALLVLDQFEELFTQNVPEVQARFARLVGRLVDESGLRVVLGLRDDFFVRCGEHPALAPVFHEVTPLLPPSPESLKRALREPAARQGVRFEDEALIDEMTAAVSAERGALPLLAFAASRLWDERDRERRLLTREAYGRIGGIAGALAQHAEATLRRLGTGREPTVRELFRNLVTAQGTRASRERAELLSVFGDGWTEAERVLDALVAARLLTAYEGPGHVDAGAVSEMPLRRAQRIEIVHESLLTHWPRLVRWQTRDADGAQLRDQLRQAARLWDERGRPEDLLWTGTSFREYELWHEHYPGRLTTTEEAFAATMTSRVRRRRRRQRLAGVAVLVVSLAVAAATSALWRRSESSRTRAEEETARAVQQTARAEAARLLTLGRLELESYPTAALAYATASLAMADIPEARRFALEALWRGPSAFILPLPPDEWWHLDLSPDDKWIAVSSFQETVLVYPSSGASPLALGGHEATALGRNVRFGPDARRLFTNAGLDPIREWSIPEGTVSRTLNLAGMTSFDLAAGRLITFNQPREGAGVSVQSWPLDGEGATPIAGPPLEGASDLAVDPTGQWLALARQRKVLVRPLSSKDSGERALGEHPHDVTRIAFDSKGTRLLSRDKEGGVRIWSMAGASNRPFRAFHAPGSGNARFGPDGAGVIVGDARARSLELWTLDGPPDAEPFRFQRADNFGNVMNTDVTSDGRWLAFVNRERVMFWPLAPVYPYVLKGHGQPVLNLVFTGNGDWLASGSFDGTVRLWPMSPRVARESRVVLGPSGEVYGLAVDRKGHRLLAGLSGPTAHLLTPGGQGHALRQLQPGVNAPWGVTFDRDGCHAVVASSYSPAGVGMVMRIWDTESARHRDVDLRAGVPRADESDPYEGGVVDLEPTPDGGILSTGFGGVRKWNPHDDSSEFLRRGEFGRSALSPDGRTLAVVSLAKRPFWGELILFDIETRRASAVPGHGKEVTNVAFDPSGKAIVSASADGAVRVGPVTGAEPHLLLGHEGSVEALAVSPDGRWIASSGQDGTVRLWPMPDLSKPPLHTLSRDALLAKLNSLTNLRAVRDPGAQTGWTLNADRFPGWANVPTW